MATTTTDHALNKDYDATKTTDHTGTTGVNGEQNARYNYGGNPLAHLNTGDSARFPAFGGEFQPGLYKPTTGRKFANPAPLGLSAFALTTFVLSLVNVGARDLTEPNIVIGLAYGYGGFVQLLAGMWYVIGRSITSWNLLIHLLGKWPLEIPLVLLLCPHTVVSGSPLQLPSHPAVSTLLPPTQRQMLQLVKQLAQELMISPTHLDSF
jgi:hypothetical protein